MKTEHAFHYHYEINVEHQKASKNMHLLLPILRYILQTVILKFICLWGIRIFSLTDMLSFSSFLLDTIWKLIY